MNSTINSWEVSREQRKESRNRREERFRADFFGFLGGFVQGRWLGGCGWMKLIRVEMGENEGFRRFLAKVFGNNQEFSKIIL